MPTKSRERSTTSPTTAHVERTQSRPASRLPYLNQEFLEKVVSEVLPRHATLASAANELQVPRTSLREAIRRQYGCDASKFLNVRRAPESMTPVEFKTTRTRMSREDALVEALTSIPSIVQPVSYKIQKPPPTATHDFLSVYPIGDPHIGMLAWAPESGEHTDLSIQKETFQKAATYIIDQGQPTREALIINLGDFFHTDNSSNETNKSGNKLDVDGRWRKVLETGVEIFINIIELALAKHEHVRVICEIGNHDEHSAIFLSVALQCRYHDMKHRVTIDTSPKLFHYHRWHRNLIGVTHGHTVKPADLESIMAVDRSEDWGQTEHRYWYIGHVHHKSVTECRGCTVESFRTLVPKDAWHSASGYRSRQDLCKIILHKEYGEVFRSTMDSTLLKAML